MAGGGLYVLIGTTVYYARYVENLGYKFLTPAAMAAHGNSIAYV